MLKQYTSVPVVYWFDQSFKSVITVYRRSNSVNLLLYHYMCFYLCLISDINDTHEYWHVVVIHQCTF